MTKTSVVVSVAPAVGSVAPASQGMVALYALSLGAAHCAVNPTGWFGWPSWGALFALLEGIEPWNPAMLETCKNRELKKDAHRKIKRCAQEKRC